MDIPLQTGDYFSIVKLVFMILFIVPWWLAAPWVNKDAHRIRSSQEMWSLLILAAGVVGVAIWLLTPIYIVGLLAYVVLVGGSLGAYVVFRNGRVSPNRKILTADHLSSLFSFKSQKPKFDLTPKVKLYGSDGKICQPPDPNQSDSEEQQAYNLTQSLLYDLLFYRASEADMAPVNQEARLRFVIDGVVTERDPLDISEMDCIIEYLKVRAGMNTEERRRPQQGKISVDIANSPSELIITTAGTTGGQRIQFKIVGQFVQTKIDELGMSEDILSRAKAISRSDNGLLLISGRSGSGVTSTLYSLLRAQDAFTKQLATLEAKTVVDLENVTQNAYGDSPNLAPTLASVLRRDPDLIMVDRCDNAEAAQIILSGAAQKVILLGIHAADSFTALARWVKLCGGDAGGAVENLRAILCQTLIRKLCPACKEAYRPDPQFLSKANLPAQKIENFYRPPTQPTVDSKGNPALCPTCQGNGYFGRTAVFEMLEVTDEIRQLIASGASPSQLQSACRKNKMLYLQEQALLKVIAGITSVQEVIRVTQQGAKKS